jgi:hypothetical protein
MVVVMALLAVGLYSSAHHLEISVFERGMNCWTAQSSLQQRW